MPTNEEKLVLLFEAQNRDVLRKLNQIERSSKKSFNNARKPLKSFNRDMQVAAKSAKNFAAAFAGGFTGVLVGGGVAGLPGVLRDIVSEASQIGKVADKVNLTTDSLQRLRYGFELTGVGVNQTDTAMQRFARRVAQAANGSGELYEILKQNGVELRNQDGSMRSQIDILRDYANVISRAGSEQEQLLLAFKAFDTEGAGLVNALRGGAAGLDVLMDKADEAGGVLDEELVRKAEEIDDAFAGLWRNFEMNAKGAILSAVREISDLVGLVQNSEFVKWLNSVENTGREAEVKAAIDVLRDADAAQTAVIGLQRDVDLLRQKIPHNEKIGFDTTEAEARLDSLIAKLNALKTSPAGLANVDPSSLPVDSAPAGDVAENVRTPVRKPAVRNYSVIPAGGRGGGGSKDRQAESVKRLIAALELERDALGKTAAEQRIMNELSRAGEGATEAQKEKIRTLVTEIENQSTAQQRANELSRFAGQQIQSQFSVITGAIKTGNDQLDRFVQSLADAALQAAFLGSGPLGSLFGGGGGTGGIFGKLFGGFRANGGDVAAGRIYGVGERGPELFVPDVPGKIVSNETLRKAAANQNVGAAPQFNIAIDATGADAAELVRVKAAIQDLQDSFNQRVISVQGQQNARGRV